MSDENSFSRTRFAGFDSTISVRRALLESLKNPQYRHAFVRERVRVFVALQIKALRDQRKMTQKGLGDEIGMAQAWVSRLENPEYGKMSVATLLRLAEAFDTDLEIRFRPFSQMLDSVPMGTEDYEVPTFEEEFECESLVEERDRLETAALQTVVSLGEYRVQREPARSARDAGFVPTKPGALSLVEGNLRKTEARRTGAAAAAIATGERRGATERNQGPIDLAV